MKVLMPVLHYCPVIGGLEIWTQNIAERLSNKAEIFVVTGKVKDKSLKEIFNGVKIFRTSLYSLKNLSYSSPFYIFSTLPFIFLKSLRFIKKEKIDMCHCQGFLSGFLGYLLKKLTKIPYIITIQSADFSLYHPKASKLGLIRIMYDFVEKEVFKNAIKAHTVSKYLQKHYESRGVKNSILIPNGVDRDKFKELLNKREVRKELGFNVENLFVCVSRLEYKNGTHDLIKAMTYLESEIADFKLIICGGGPDRKKLEKMKINLGLEKEIVFLGDVLHSEIPKYIACSDIFIRPSLAEGFGIVFLEAMACNVPVIGTPVGGIPDFLEDKKTGLFCQPGNPKDIAEKIKILIYDKELRNNIIKNAKEMIIDVYGWDKTSEQVGEVYKEVKRDYDNLNFP